ncbi:MAG: zf-HC2 domain-containing protein [Actinobacteria bacterium]|nr:zf-HC2 domain-containing protein [Actinomycetota bacterium]
MNCVAVRDRLPEMAVDAVPAREALTIDRHLAWCAACRREAEDLRRAAALLPYALAPVTPAPDLEERVAALVGERTGRSRLGTRRARSGAAAVVAAMVATAALGWGSVMAGRADRMHDQVMAAQEAQHQAYDRFARLLQSGEFQDPANDVYLGTLTGSPGSSAGGAALTLTSPSSPDFAVVSVNGLPTGPPDSMPYVVTLETAPRGPGSSVVVGKIAELDSGGAARVGRDFNRDLTGLTRVVVRDATGNVLLSGELDLYAAVTSPSP